MIWVLGVLTASCWIGFILLIKQWNAWDDEMRVVYRDIEENMQRMKIAYQELSRADKQHEKHTDAVDAWIREKRDIVYRYLGVEEVWDAPAPGSHRLVKKVKHENKS